MLWFEKPTSEIATHLESLSVVSEIAIQLDNLSVVGEILENQSTIIKSNLINQSVWMTNTLHRHT